MSEKANIPPEKNPENKGQKPASVDGNSSQKFPEDKQAPANKEPATQQQKPETENMEVHHHSHTSRKKWTHYFWEFFMLFLAVTAGFFVENQREHYIEHQREKQFIRSLINDVKADTAKLMGIIDSRLVREQRLDSMNYLMNNSPALHTGQLYFFAVTAARTLPFRFVSNDGTMQQLKNSGALRLIRSRTVADSIAKYDVGVRNYLRQGELEETLIHDYRSAAANIFDALVFDQMLDTNNNVSRRPEGNPPLLDYEKRDLSSWNYKLYSMKALNKANRRDARLLLRQASNLIQTLKEEYHLE